MEFVSNLIHALFNIYQERNLNIREIAPAIVQTLNYILSINSPQQEFKNSFAEHLKEIKNNFYEKDADIELEMNENEMDEEGKNRHKMTQSAKYRIWRSLIQSNINSFELLCQLIAYQGEEDEGWESQEEEDMKAEEESKGE